MGIEQIISLETKEGHEYLIKLNPIDINVLPTDVQISVVDVTIELVIVAAQTAFQYS